MKVENVNKRDWLNPLGHYDTESISVKIHNEDGYHEAELVIRDCSKQINIDLSAGRMSGTDFKKRLKQRLKKVRLMQSYLEHLENNLKDCLNHR
jgi:hypothetical protein